MIYKELPPFSAQEAIRIVDSGELEELRLLPLSAGMECSNWKHAQDLCLQLVEHGDDWVSANAILGLSYVAMNHKRLEKHRVKPALHYGLRHHSELRGKVEDAVGDINLFLGWNINQ